MEKFNASARPLNIIRLSSKLQDFFSSHNLTFGNWFNCIYRTLNNNYVHAKKGVRKIGKNLQNIKKVLPDWSKKQKKRKYFLEIRKLLSEFLNDDFYCVCYVYSDVIFWNSESVVQNVENTECDFHIFLWWCYKAPIFLLLLRMR